MQEDKIKQLKHFLDNFDRQNPSWEGAPETFFNEENETEFKKILTDEEYNSYHIAKFIWDLKQATERRFSYF